MCIWCSLWGLNRTLYTRWALSTVIIGTENIMEKVYSFCIIALHTSVSNVFMAIFCLWQQRNLFKSSCKVSYFNQIGIFLTDFHKRPKCQFKKIHSVGAELIHADMTKLIGTFHVYVKMAINTCIIIMNHSPPCTQHVIQCFWHWRSLITYLFYMYHRFWLSLYKINLFIENIKILFFI
jgi:hypothetical protein